MFYFCYLYFLKKTQKPLALNEWDDKTSKFIDTFAKFPLLYDGDHPLQNNFEEIEKTMVELSNALVIEHNIELKDGHLSDAVEQLKSWYYIAKQRHGKMYNKLNQAEEDYFKQCSFMPEKRLKLKYTCKICNKNFNMEHNFKTHMYKVHQEGDLPFQCNVCGKKFDAKTTVSMHIQRMHRIRNYSCNVCHKLFALPSELKFHYMVHTAEKNHVCELCGKAFRIKTQLRYHRTAIHTKIRAYKCTMCPKDFLKKRDLTDHVKTHLNIRDKICETCGKGFSNSHSLIRHRQIHSAVKRYECKLCDAKFHQFVGLNGHMKRTHNIVKKKDP